MTGALWHTTEAMSTNPHNLIYSVNPPICCSIWANGLYEGRAGSLPRIAGLRIQPGDPTRPTHHLLQRGCYNAQIRCVRDRLDPVNPTFP